ncbi:Hypothetical predicted protein [Podarcis lilfordi]|uniref:Uncharacterized protein n=1 Tax=Podarcis lilfordi TaxID=74358 RepID=A0AA35P8C1_9SAUR|nr:Hypothetical predicted protein [Podarcis lilfordi]
MDKRKEDLRALKGEGRSSLKCWTLCSKTNQYLHRIVLMYAGATSAVGGSVSTLPLSCPIQMRRRGNSDRRSFSKLGDVNMTLKISLQHPPTRRFSDFRARCPQCKSSSDLGIPLCRAPTASPTVL